MKHRKALQIAIDGPAASGKTTVAQRVAQLLQVRYLDTGAMYRALASLALHTRTDVDNGAALARLWLSHHDRVALDDPQLQSNEVTAIVSTVAAHGEVREAMVRAQRRIAGDGPVIMAGRDIGTVVLPEAPVKIYLTASVPARVMRRRAQLQEAGVDVDAHRLAQEIEERDRIDRTRAISPLAPAPDAHVIDSSDMTADEVVDEICTIVTKTVHADR